MDLKSLTQLGRVEQEVEIAPDFKFKIHTLSVGEQQKALLSISQEITDETAKLLQLQKAVLVYATDSINGEVIEKDKLQSLYTEVQPVILSKLFESYVTLSDTQGKVLEELKKK